MSIKQADWVEATGSPGHVGFVKKVARDGSWADVRWNVGGREHVKRMRTEYLRVLTTIPIGAWAVTDMTREREIAEARQALGGEAS